MIDFNQPENITFTNENVAAQVRVSPDADINGVIKSLHLVRPRALLILNGRTKDLPEALKDRLTPLFAGLAELVVEKRIAVITGGTNAGIFSLFGMALQKFGGAAAPCIGVSVAGRTHPDRRAGQRGSVEDRVLQARTRERFACGFSPLYSGHHARASA